MKLMNRHGAKLPLSCLQVKPCHDQPRDLLSTDLGGFLKIVTVKTTIALGCALLMALCACKKETKALKQIEPPSAPPKAVTQGPKINLTEAEALGRALEQTVQNQNAAEFETLLDLAAMVNHGMPHEMRGTAQAKEVTRGILSTLSGNLLKNLSAGDYRFLSVEETADGATAHMRLIPADGSLNYHRLTIGRNTDQKAVAVDVYVYVTGEPLSHTIGRMVGQLSGGSEVDTLAVAQGMQRASAALQASKPATAEAILSALPPRWQKQKSIMQMRIMAANGVAAQKLQAGKPIGNAYRKAVEAFQTRFPKADNLPLILINYHFLEQDFPKAAKAVDQLDQQVGGDPYLNLIRANIAVGQNDAQAARGFVETLIKALPDKAPEGYGILLDQAIEIQNHVETTRILKALEAETPVRFPFDFNKAEPFAAYMASPEYEKWKAYKNGAEQP